MNNHESKEEISNIQKKILNVFNVDKQKIKIIYFIIVKIVLKLYVINVLIHIKMKIIK